MRLLDQQQSSIQVTDDDVIYILDEVGGIAYLSYDWPVANIVYVTLSDDELHIELDRYSPENVPLLAFVYKNIDSLNIKDKNLEETLDWLRNAQVPDDVKKAVEKMINMLREEMKNFNVTIVKVTTDIYMGDILIPLGTSTFYYAYITAYDYVDRRDRAGSDEKYERVKKLVEKIEREMPEIVDSIIYDTSLDIVYNPEIRDYQELDTYQVYVSFPIASRELISALRNILNSQLS
ncbi:MAG: hypothetical protein QXS16_00440 [Pyrobaculum sp.]